MTVTAPSRRQFNRDVSKAKNVAKDSPVFMSDRGHPAHVLLSIEAYRRLTASASNIIDQLAMPDAESIEFEAPREDRIASCRPVLMFLLDTHVIAELRKAKAGRADSNVTTWATHAESSALFLSAISILELEAGVLLVERRDSDQGAVLRQWLENQVLAAFVGRGLPVDATVAQRCARLHVPNRCAERDALIAATALVHGMTVMTRNVADFERTGVAVINPWRGDHR